MNLNAPLCTGLADPVHDAQHSFRVALEALSRPATIHSLGPPIARLPLGAAMAHLLLTLTDEDTAVWWQDRDRALRQWLRFHTGARACDSTDGAAFAVVTEVAELPELRHFCAGTLAAPGHSCTLLVEMPSLHHGPKLQAHGPGIRESQPLAPGGLPEGFWAEWQASHAGFPQGVDIFFTCGNQFMGLPRTTRISRLQEA